MAATLKKKAQKKTRKPVSTTHAEHCYCKECSFREVDPLNLKQRAKADSLAKRMQGKLNGAMGPGVAVVNAPPRRVPLVDLAGMGDDLRYGIVVRVWGGLEIVMDIREEPNNSLRRAMLRATDVLLDGVLALGSLAAV